MKTKIISLISLIILLTSTSDKVNAKSPISKNIDKVLKKEISYPDFAKRQKLEGIVLVSFSVNSDGTICINLTNESNASLKDYVISKIEKLKVLPSKDNVNKIYNVKFDFKFEK